MANSTILKKIAEDLAFLKDKVVQIETTVNEIGEDIHRELNPEYLKKLEKIQRQKGVRFKDMKEFEDYFLA